MHASFIRTLDISTSIRLVIKHKNKRNIREKSHKNICTYQTFTVSGA